MDFGSDPTGLKLSSVVENQAIDVAEENVVEEENIDVLKLSAIDFTGLPPLPGKVENLLARIGSSMAAISDLDQNATREKNMTDQLNSREDLTLQDETNQFESNLAADHPLLENVQKTIYEQLSSHEKILESEIRVLEEQLNNESKEREALGVQLHNAQSRLTRLNTMHTNTENSYLKVSASRNQREIELKEFKESNDREQELFAQSRILVEQQRIEIAATAKSMQQLELLRNEQNSKILISKNSGSKAEKDILKREIETKRQVHQIYKDFIINDLVEQLQSLRDEKVKIDSQISGHLQEKTAAEQIAQNTAVEIESVRIQMCKLVNQWKCSLADLKEQDQIIAGVEQAIAKKDSDLNSEKLEIQSFQKSIKQAERDSQTTSEALAKITNDIVFAKIRIDSLDESYESLMVDHTAMTSNLSQLELSSANVVQEQTKIQQEIIKANKNLIAQSINIQELELTIVEISENDSSSQKGFKMILNSLKEIKEETQEKNSRVSNIQNSINSAELEYSNCESRITHLAIELREVNIKLGNSTEIYENIEKELEKKIERIRVLTKDVLKIRGKYDQLIEASEDSHVGPLEAIIYNLGQSISLKNQECSTLQQKWLQVQIELVTMENGGISISEEIRQIRMRLSHQNKNKIVADLAFQMENKLIGQVCRSVQHLRNDVKVLGDRLCAQSDLYGKLEESNFCIEIKSLDKLKLLELKSIRLKDSLMALEDKQAQNLDSLNISRQELMLWEKKIQLATETKLALDPNIGASETKDMLIEIHRMSVRYAGILKAQQKMIAEIEKGVKRGSDLSSKSISSMDLKSDQKILDKEIGRLNKKIAQAKLELKALEKEFLSVNNLHILAVDRNNLAQTSIASFSDKLAVLDAKFTESEFQKHLNTQSIILLQKLQKRYQELSAGVYRLVQPKTENLASSSKKQRENLLIARNLLIKIMSECRGDVKPIIAQLNAFFNTTCADLKIM